MENGLEKATITGVPQGGPLSVVCSNIYLDKLYKELERLIAINKIGMSVDKVLDAAKTITTIRVRMPENGTYFTKTLFLTEKHLAVKPLFDLSGNKS